MPNLKLLAFMLYVSPLWASPSVSVLSGIKPGTITFIGEIHHRVESPLLIKRLVNDLVASDECPIVALEIGSDQQPVIDRVMAGETPAGVIEISDIIGHEPYRLMIDYFARMKSRGACLGVVAIDAGEEATVDRNKWMAARLSSLPTDRPVVVLVGALHTLKRVKWTVPTGKPSVAEILANRGFRVKSFPQGWIPRECPEHSIRRQRFVEASDPEALTILNETLLSLLNAEPAESVDGIVDGFIVWECDG